MSFKRKQQNTSVFEVNDKLLKIISPSGIDFTDRRSSVGDNIGCIYYIASYKENNEYGWLAPLCNLEGTATTIAFHYTDPGILIKYFDKQISELSGNKGSLRKQSELDINDKKIDDLKKLIKRLAVSQEPVGYILTILHIQAQNEKELEERIKRVNGIVSTQGCSMKMYKYRYEQALKVIPPYGMINEDIFKVGSHNMPVSTFLGGFPMANPGLNDEGGYYLAKTANNRIIRINPWIREKDRTNSNWVIFGIPGVGKSTTVKNILILEYAFMEVKIIILDPEDEYIEMAYNPNINGDVIDCGGGIKGRINPLQVRKTATIKKEDLEDGENIEDFLQFSMDEEKINDLALYLQQLKIWFSLYFGKEDFTTGIETLLEQALIETYKDFGITWETDIDVLSNEDYPILSDLRNKVIEMQNKEQDMSDYKKGNYEKLIDLLYSCTEGSDQFYWNGYTTLDAKVDFVVLSAKALFEASERVRRAQFYNITSWAWGEMSRDKTQKVDFVVDEGHLTIDPDYPEIMKYIKNISKRDRKYEGGLIFITQSVIDVTAKEVKRFGQPIIDNACYKLIMGCDGKNLQEAKNTFNLSEDEVNFLAQKNRSSGILCAGNTRLQATVDVNEQFLEIMGSGGGR